MLLCVSVSFRYQRPHANVSVWLSQPAYLRRENEWAEDGVSGSAELGVRLHPGMETARPGARAAATHRRPWLAALASEAPRFFEAVCDAIQQAARGLVGVAPRACCT